MFVYFHAYRCRSLRNIGKLIQAHCDIEDQCCYYYSFIAAVLSWCLFSCIDLWNLPDSLEI